jgi:hypothetical protein
MDRDLVAYAPGGSGRVTRQEQAARGHLAEAAVIIR